MKQIKTVIYPLESAYSYDDTVNSLIAEGWELKKRTTIHACGEMSESFNAPIVKALYAELERNVPPFPEEVTE